MTVIKGLLKKQRLYDVLIYKRAIWLKEII
jgi:hypothetical protein